MRLPLSVIGRKSRTATRRKPVRRTAFTVSELAVTPGDINSFAEPQVETGAYQVQIGTPASLSAGFTIHG